MASISSISGGKSSSSSSIFGKKNVISGLASGMDTESMIENAVSGYKMKISRVQQQREKMEWQQTAYRNIIQKMVNFNQKYATLASGNDLISGSFFDNAIKVIANGANADKVSATGKGTSTVQVNSITQLATSSTYSTKGNLSSSNVATGSFDVNAVEDIGKLDGSLTLGYGDNKVQISFNDSDVFKNADDMVAAINKKLEDQTMILDKGTEVKASDRLVAVNDGGTISFKTKNSGDATEVWIDSASQSIDTALGINTTGDGKDIKSFHFDKNKVMEEKPLIDVLSEKGFTITFNGETKTIKGPTMAELNSSQESGTLDEKYVKELQKKINGAFGPNTTLKVGDADTTNGKIQLKFEGAGNDRFEVRSSIEDKIGMQGGVGSALNTSSTLGDLLKGNEPASYDFKIKDAAGNEKTIATFTKDSTLQDVIDTINKSADSPVKVSYSKFTGKFMFESKETGANTNFDFGTGLASAMFGSTSSADPSSKYTAGQNAEFEITVNGDKQTINQSSNTIDIDGMKLTMKDTFGAAGTNNEAVTFNTTADADKIVTAVKAMVEDYNALAEEIKKAYSSMPLTDSSGNYYAPLTEEDRADMSESAIKAYEEKAKTGILFADRELATLYDGMTRALGVLGTTGNDSLKLGLTVSYKDGASTLAFDENQFRKALENDPEKVKEVFTGSKAKGDARDGLMQGLKTQLDKYSKTTGAIKGVLVQKAGSPLAPTTMYQNTWQKKIDDYEKQISALQGKMSNQVDYYTRQFSALEQMILQMNNQSSMLMGLNGGF